MPLCLTLSQGQKRRSESSECEARVTGLFRSAAPGGAVIRQPSTYAGPQPHWTGLHGCHRRRRLTPSARHPCQRCTHPHRRRFTTAPASIKPLAGLRLAGGYGVGASPIITAASAVLSIQSRRPLHNADLLCASLWSVRAAPRISCVMQKPALRPPPAHPPPPKGAPVWKVNA